MVEHACNPGTSYAEGADFCKLRISIFYIAISQSLWLCSKTLTQISFKKKNIQNDKIYCSTYMMQALLLCYLWIRKEDKANKKESRQREGGREGRKQQHSEGWHKV